MKSREEVEALKANWKMDPIWDIEDTEGYEEYRHELEEYRLRMELEWKIDHMNRASSTGGFSQWCLVEIMGHQRLVGRVTEQEIGPGAFIRVDVPEVNGIPAFTKFYGTRAIYSMTPISEDLAWELARRYQVRPVTVIQPADLFQRQDYEERENWEE